MANGTVHAVLHLGWVPDGSGGYGGQMAVLVKPNGLLGTIYMAAIKPLRYLIVYPPLMRGIQRKCRRSAATGASGRQRPRARPPGADSRRRAVARHAFGRRRSIVAPRALAPLRLDGGLQPGAAGGHGPVR